MSIGFTSEQPPAGVPEHVVWRAEKGARVAEARVRVYPHGHELRVAVDGDLVWSRLFRLDALAEAPKMAHGCLVDFERVGWTRQP